ncbi:MAG: hypothetical protein COB42_04725 [Sulfurimonas sp.]|nr:MAG: hypothetical protein COB42_04725 [Sulfurimonas sp.]
MNNVVKISLMILSVVFFLGCSTKTYTIKIHEPLSKNPSEKQIALFLDGTQNDLQSKTNISALSEIIDYQDRDNLYLFYNEGVGTGGRFLGAATGLGIGNDVRQAYTFLSAYYTPDSKLYLFGFSRGSYTSRILAGMIYSVGIYDLKRFTKKDRITIVKELYTVYKDEDEIYKKAKEQERIKQIKEDAQNIITSWEKNDSIKKLGKKTLLHENVKIEVMGLWDTVEALGLTPTIEAFMHKVFGIEDPQDIVHPNERYIDQICNIKHIYHALSLDDNRANVFTPIILSSDYVSKCPKPEDSLLSKVNEVWFSGAHADIGGGYTKNENNKKGEKNIDRKISIPGVSLNWMLSKLKIDAPMLVPQHAQVFENFLGYVHNAENGDGKYYKRTRHNLMKKYIQDSSKHTMLKVHASVIKRLATNNNAKKERGYDSKWYTKEPFKKCFLQNKDGSFIFKGCQEIIVVE